MKEVNGRKELIGGLLVMNPDFRNTVPGAWLDKFNTVPMPEVAPAPQNVPSAALFGGILPERQVTPEERLQFVAAYRAQTAFMDAQIGLVLDAVDAANTIVVFTSMTGFHLGDHGNLWGNRSLYARSAQGPLVIAAHDEQTITHVLNYGGHSGIALRNAFASYMRWG
jgi:arylsulfatase A-like enzyme